MLPNNIFNTKLGQYVNSQGQPQGTDPSIFVAQNPVNNENPMPAGMNNLLALRIPQPNDPTFIPVQFSDQFYFQNNGVVWIYNGSWKALGNMEQMSGTTLPSATTYSGQYYYLTTTDTLYRSNGIAWISLN